MARSSFTEKQFTCSLCGDTFQALASPTPVADPVCMSCGLRHGPEKLRRLIRERKERTSK